MHFKIIGFKLSLTLMFFTAIAHGAEVNDIEDAEPLTYFSSVNGADANYLDRYYLDRGLTYKEIISNPKAFASLEEGRSEIFRNHISERIGKNGFLVVSVERAVAYGWLPYKKFYKDREPLELFCAIPIASVGNAVKLGAGVIYLPIAVINELVGSLDDPLEESSLKQSGEIHKAVFLISDATLQLTLGNALKVAKTTADFTGDVFKFIVEKPFNYVIKKPIQKIFKKEDSKD